MSNVIPFPTADQRKQEQMPLDALRDDYGDPDSVRVRRENLRLTERNPRATHPPQRQWNPDGPSAA